MKGQLHQPEDGTSIESFDRSDVQLGSLDDHAGDSTPGSGNTGIISPV